MYQLIFQVGRVLANGPGDRGSIPGRIIPKTQKIVLINSLPNTQRYKLRIKGKWSNPGVVAIEKGAFESAPTTVANFTYFYSFFIHS